MYIEAAKIVSDWLKNANYGVNAMLATIPLESGDESPPAVQDILNEVDDIEATARRQPQNYPALVIVTDDPIIIDPTIGTGVKQKISDLPVAIRYFNTETDLVRLRRQTMYTLRAIKKALWRLDYNANQDDRTRNGVCLIKANQIIAMEIRETVGDATVVGALVATYEADDLDP